MIAGIGIRSGGAANVCEGRSGEGAGRRFIDQVADLIEPGRAVVHARLNARDAVEAKQLGAEFEIARTSLNLLLEGSDLRPGLGRGDGRNAPDDGGADGSCGLRNGLLSQEGCENQECGEG